MRRFRETLDILFGIDLRALAALRMGFGLLLLVDLLIRASDLRAHYSDFGVLPRSALLSLADYPELLSLHFINGSLEIQAVLFGLAGYFAVALLVGYKTRLASVLSWFLLISLHNRNFLVLHGGDTLLRAALFWGMFLPWGERYALDNLADVAPPPRPVRVRTSATTAYLLQIASVYVFTALLKSGKEWLPEGTAVYYALSFDQLTAPLGQALYAFPMLLHYVTFGVWWWELLGPFCLFFPVVTIPVRLIALGLFFGMHLGIHLCMELGLFHWISMVCLLPFVPSSAWDAMSRVGSGPVQALWVRLHASLTGGASMSSAPLPVWRRCKAQFSAAMVQVYGALLAAVRGTAQPPRTLTCPSTLLNVTLLFFLFYVLLWNVAELLAPRYSMPRWLQSIGFFYHIDQNWAMFAPYPAKEDGWYVMAGQLRDGRVVDVFRGGQPIVWDKPAAVARLYPNQRWQKYLLNFWLTRHSKYRPYYGHYLCRAWNRQHPPPTHLVEVTIYYMLERTLPDYRVATPEKVVVLEHTCTL